MSYSDYGSYLNRRVNKQNCCCQKGDVGATGPGAINGISPQLTYIGTTPNVINSTPDAHAVSATNQIQFTDGNVTNPVISFQTDEHTGMYRTGTDSIGFSTGGNQKLTIANITGTPTDMINGVTVGTTTAPIAGIRRVCSDISNSWEEGNAGNSSQLVFVPSDFMIANPTTAGGGRGVGAIETSFMNLVSGGTTWTTGSGVLYGQPVIGTNNADSCLVATKLIPKGFTITSTSRVTIFGRVAITPTKLSVAVRKVSATSLVADAHVNTTYTMNGAETLADLATPGEGDGQQFIIIYFQPDVQLTSDDGIRGAIVTMERY